jgi:3-oxoacyl-[acyl-carrier protein] reductase
VIIVTGATKGLGAAICARLQSKNIKVFGLARSFSGHSFDGMECDISSYENVKTVAKKLKNANLKITGLINAAGIASMNLAVATTPNMTQKIIQTNLVGTIYCCQIFSPLMFRNKGGIIINFSTIAVSLGLKGESVYVASKAGVEGFSRSFARETADFNVRVNCIAPGPINTDLLKGVSPEQIDRIVSQQVLQKQFVPSDVCDLVELLLDDKSGSLSGQVLNVGGA